MAEYLYPLDTELSIDTVALIVCDELFTCGGFAPSVALAKCPEYDFLDSGVVISDDATSSVAVCNLSALIAKQCKVHQIEC